MRRATTPARIGRITFDAIIKRETVYEADAPEYPVESGFYVSDSVLKKPVTLNVTAFISDSPVTWSHLREKNRLEATINKLEKLYFSGEMFVFYTSKKNYNNMVMTSLTIPETEDMGNAVEISFTLKQIRVTKAKTSIIPEDYGLGGNTAGSGGTAGTTEEKDESILGKACSWLYGLFKGE